MHVYSLLVVYKDLPLLFFAFSSLCLVVHHYNPFQIAANVYSIFIFVLHTDDEGMVASRTVFKSTSRCRVVIVNGAGDVVVCVRTISY